MRFSSFQGPDIVNNTFPPASFPKEGKKTAGCVSASPVAWQRLGVLAGGHRCPYSLGRPPAAPSSSSPRGKPHPSSLYPISALLRYSWQLSYKLLFILSIGIKLCNIIAKPPLGTRQLTRLSSLKSVGSCNFLRSPKTNPCLFFFPPSITKVFLNIDCRGILHCQCLLRISEYLSVKRWLTLIYSVPILLIFPCRLY